MSEANPTTSKPLGLEIVNAMELVETRFPQSDDIVEGILPQRAKLVLSAPAKLGKTIFTLGLSLGMATGRNVMGFQVKGSHRVLYFQAEVSPRSLQGRLRQMLGVFPETERSEIVRLVKENLLFCNDPRLKLTQPEAVVAISEAVATHQPKVVIFDPLYKYNSGDENSVKEMTKFFDPLDDLIARYGVSVVVVHHHGKGGNVGWAIPAHSNRGASTITDWPDSLLTLTHKQGTDRIVKLSFTLRNAEEPPPMAYRLNPETLWFEQAADDYEPAGKGSKHKVSSENVASIIGESPMQYSTLAKSIQERFSVSERTAKDAITRAVGGNAIHKNAGGFYVKGGAVQDATPYKGDCTACTTSATGAASAESVQVAPLAP